MSPAAGPLMVSSELLTNVARIDPMMAVKMPAIGGYPHANQMPRHSGSAIKNTRNPEIRSCLRYFAKTAGRPRGISSSAVTTIDDFPLPQPRLKQLQAVSSGRDPKIMGRRTGNNTLPALVRFEMTVSCAGWRRTDRTAQSTCHVSLRSLASSRSTVTRYGRRDHRFRFIRRRKCGTRVEISCAETLFKGASKVT